jgi:peptide/nickel transport system substrate-binding protein
MQRISNSVSSALMLAFGFVVACGGAVAPTAGGPATPSAASIKPFVYATGTDGSQNYDPMTAANPFAAGYLAPVFDTLVSVAGDGSINPALATSWEIGADNAMLTLHLRSGVQFHDGTPFDAAALKANIQRGQTLLTSTIKDQLQPITDVEVLDPTTVRLHLTGQASTVLASFGDRPGMMLSPADFDRPDVQTRPIGTGPWQIAASSVVGRDMIYEAFPKYWDPSVQKIHVLDIRVLAAPAVKNGLIDHSIDLALPLDPQIIADVKNAGIPGTPLTIEFLYILYLNHNSVFKNEKVRQALSLAIDRQQLSDAVMEQTCAPDSQPFEPASPYYRQGLETTAFNLVKAKQLLTDSGLPDGFSFTAVVGAGVPTVVNQLQAMEQTFRMIGVNMTINQLPPVQLVKTFTSGQTEAYFSAYPGAASVAGVAAALTNQLNPGGYSDPQMTQFAQLAAGTTDPRTRTTAYQSWSQRFQETAFDLAVCNGPGTSFAQKGVSGVRYAAPTHMDPRGLAKES